MEQNENYTIKEEKNCINCGAVNDSKNILCEKCGKSIYELDEQNNNIGFSSETYNQERPGKKLYMVVGFIFMFYLSLIFYWFGIPAFGLGLILYFSSPSSKILIQNLLYAAGKFVFGIGIISFILFGVCTLVIFGGA